VGFVAFLGIAAGVIAVPAICCLYGVAVYLMLIRSSFLLLLNHLKP
jgi:hypothetical protein